MPMPQPFRANVEYVVKNDVTYSLSQILAPFKTPLAMSARKKAIYAYQRACVRSRADVVGRARPALVG